METEMETYASLLSKHRRCESRSFSQPIYLAKRWGLYLPPSLSPQLTPSPTLVTGQTPLEHPPRCKEIRTSCDLDVGRLPGLAWSPGRNPRLMKIFELGWAHTYTHTRTHTHTCEWVHVSALIAGIWKFRHLFDQLLPFSYQETNVENKWQQLRQQKVQKPGPTISYATHIVIASGLQFSKNHVGK